MCYMFKLKCMLIGKNAIDTLINIVWVKDYKQL